MPLAQFLSALAISCVAVITAASAPALAEKRVALVVGNGSYANAPALPNPPNDARAMAGALKSTGFQVVEAIDADRRALDAALRAFTDQLAGADVALFFYAGHGLQVGAQNYLVPIDAKLGSERDLEFETVRLDFVLRQMEIDREGRTSIVFLDACRDNPLARNLARSMGTRSVAIGRGLAPATTGVGTFIAFATQPGNVARDGGGRNSPFTSALTKHMRESGRNLPATMIEVRKDVIAETGGHQVPWDHSALTGDFYFVPTSGTTEPGARVSAAPPSAGAADLAALQERLARLEAEAKARGSSPAGTTPGAMITADGIRLAELRARAASLDDLVKDLQGKLFDSRREERQTSDPAEKQKRLKRSMDIQMEWTRRGMDLRKVRDEIAALEGKASSARAQTTAIPPVEPKPDPNASAALFEPADNVRLEGAEIRAFKAPNPDACRNACAEDANCLGYHHGRKAANMGQCRLFSTIASRHEDKSWRSGVRKSGADSPARLPGGFEMLADQTALGEVIKSTRADSANGCIVVCRNTPACVGGRYTGKATVDDNCEVLSGITSITASPGATSFRHHRQ